MPQIPTAAMRTSTSPARGLLEVEVADLERPPGLVEDGRAGIVTRPAPRSRHRELVTVETFCSAKLIDALCHSAFIVEQPSSGTTME